jgi:hypothetical protein
MSLLLSDDLVSRRQEVTDNAKAAVDEQVAEVVRKKAALSAFADRFLAKLAAAVTDD